MQNREDFAVRLQALERLLAFFRVERTLHLVVTAASEVVLLFAAAKMIVSGTAEISELAVIFGASGLIAYSSGRLLHMWNMAIKLLYGDERER